MKPSHFQTPRTLADCQWATGYSSAQPPRTAASIALAISIGVLLALALVNWWAS